MFCICGRVNIGKSALINAIRGLEDNDPKAAKVGDGEVTTKISKFTWEHKNLYDFAGYGTLTEPDDDYFMRKGLCNFHGIVLLRDSAIQQADINFARKAIEFNVPLVFVQSKMDEVMGRKKRDREISEINATSIKFIIKKLKQNHRDYMGKNAPDLADIPCFFISSDSMRELMKLQKSLGNNKFQDSLIPDGTFLYEEDKLINQLLIMMYQSCEQEEKLEEVTKRAEKISQAEEEIVTMEEDANEIVDRNERMLIMEETIEKLRAELIESTTGDLKSEDDKSCDSNEDDENDEFEVFEVPEETENYEDDIVENKKV
uniref:IRG-type G domain-containing protein n=1 Tax=Acrobeloides nanus TaxID=290746 RepID=A0A914CRZ2_9BILA